MWIADPASDYTVPTTGCRWPVIESCVDDIELDESLKGWAQQAAIETLWAASGRRYGLCDRPARPCLPGCNPGWENTAWWMLGDRTHAFSFAPFLTTRCARCQRSCNCSVVHEIELWDRAVRRITAVTVDGVLLGPSLYRRQGRWLIRKDGVPVVYDDWTDAIVIDGVSAALADITIAGDVTSAGAIIDLGVGAYTFDLGAVRDDPTVTLFLTDGATVQALSVTSVTGEGELSAGVVTGSGGAVVLHFASGTETINLTVDDTGTTLAAIQWSDLTADNPGWPRCQNRNVDSGEVGSWTVDYMYGTPVPVGGQIAAGLLACEYMLALAESDDCTLPVRVRTKVVEGQSYGFIDPLTFLTQGITGLGGIVDQWIVSVNPNRLARPARAFRADDPRLSKRRG